MNKTDHQFQMTVNTEQAEVLLNALDFFARIHIGQFQIIVDQFREVDYDHERVYQLLHDLRIQLLPSLGPFPGHSLGIRKGPQAAQIAYDILQVMRNCVAFA